MRQNCKGYTSYKMQQRKIVPSSVSFAETELFSLLHFLIRPKSESLSL